MRSPLRPLLGTVALALGAAAAAHAQTAKTSAAPAAAASAARAPAHVTVIEDDNVRIEESHGRGGSVTKVTVRTKAAGAKDYEVQVGPPGRDPNLDKGSAGRRTWSVLSF